MDELFSLCLWGVGSGRWGEIMTFAIIMNSMVDTGIVSLILQVLTESLCVCVCMCVCVCEFLNCVRLFVTPWTIACQVPLSIEFSRQEYWSGLLFPSPGDLLDPGIESRSPAL